MTKRKEQVPRPAKSDEWSIQAANNNAAKGWDALCKAAPGPTATMFDSLTDDPRRVANRDRQGKLKGTLSTAEVQGSTFDQWQYEVTGGGRVWYVMDDSTRTVWITLASASHPKATE